MLFNQFFNHHLIDTRKGVRVDTIIDLLMSFRGTSFCGQSQQALAVVTELLQSWLIWNSSSVTEVLSSEFYGCVNRVATMLKVKIIQSSTYCAIYILNPMQG